MCTTRYPLFTISSARLLVVFRFSSFAGSPIDLHFVGSVVVVVQLHPYLHDSTSSGGAGCGSRGSSTNMSKQACPMFFFCKYISLVGTCVDVPSATQVERAPRRSTRGFLIPLERQPMSVFLTIMRQGRWMSSRCSCCPLAPHPCLASPSGACQAEMQALTNRAPFLSPLL